MTTMRQGSQFNSKSKKSAKHREVLYVYNIHQQSVTCFKNIQYLSRQTTQRIEYIIFIHIHYTQSIIHNIHLLSIFTIQPRINNIYSYSVHSKAFIILIHIHPMQAIYTFYITVVYGLLMCDFSYNTVFKDFVISVSYNLLLFFTWFIF